jgi:hypothetical protein
VKPVVYHPEASAEFDAAADCYEALAVGLGNSSIDEVEAIVGRIAESPGQFPAWQGNRRFQKAVLLETFPFVVFFRELDDHIRILAIATAPASPGIGRGACEHGAQRFWRQG